MNYKNYNRIIELLNTKFNKIKHVEVLRDVNVPDYRNTENKLIILNRGKVVFGKGAEQIILKPGDIFFLPEHFLASVTYGSKEASILNNNKFINYEDQYLRFIDDPSIAPNQEVFSYISFQVRVHDAIDFFRFIDIPAFVIQDNPKFSALVQKILEEHTSDNIGKEEILKLNTKHLIIMLIRHILNKKLFLEQIVLKTGILMDVRLMVLFKYIANNIEGDLSNVVLAREAGFPKDYMGQYFKKLTKFNLQEFIDIIRSSKAMELLKSTDMKIYDISKACGYKDISYFCRKFKASWDTTAKKMRKRNSINS